MRARERALLALVVLAGVAGVLFLVRARRPPAVVELAPPVRAPFVAPAPAPTARVVQPVPRPTVNARPLAKPRRTPPAFVTNAPPRSDLPIMKSHEVPPPVMRAISNAAHRTMPRDRWKAGMQCLRDLARRRPELVDEEGWANGAVALTIETKQGLARILAVDGIQGEDEEATTCLREKMPWLSGAAFDAAGADDGVLKMEWSYSVATRPPSPG